MDKKIRISINEKITLNLTKENASKIVDGWTTKSIMFNEDSFKDLFKSYGMMCGNFKHSESYRKKENIESFNSIMLDFDKGTPSFSEIHNRIIVWKYPAILFTSSGHLKDNNPEKFRVFIPLKDEITLNEYYKLIDYLLEQFPTLDRGSLKDVSRYYYPSPCELFYFHFPENAEFYDAKEILKYVIDEKKEQTKYTKKDRHFSSNDYIKLHNGAIIQINEIKEKTSCFCPFCNPSDRSNPDNHNAFIDLNKNGVYYLSCSSESVTRWQHPDEIEIYNSMDLWFSTENGTPASIDTDGDLHYYSRKSDWTNYCKQNQIDEYITDFLPRLKLKFNPTLEYGKNIDKNIFNLYKESEMLVFAKNNKIDSNDCTFEYLQENTPTIFIILKNLFGKDEYINHFLNWLSYIVQLKKKPFTSWIISSIGGAGKNMLFEKVITPIVGNKYCSLINSDRLTDKFNSLDYLTIIKAVDEIFMTNNFNVNNQRKQFIKSEIASNVKLIEKKGENIIPIENFLSYLLFTNEGALSFALDENDRRFNVIHNPKGVELSKQSWWWGRSKFESKVQSELNNFAIYLMSRPVNESDANTPLITEIKKLIEQTSKDDVKILFDLIKERKWDELEIDEMDIENKSMIISEIKEINAIPAKYMYSIGEHWVGKLNRLNKNKLKALGLVNTVRKTPDGRSIKCYIARKVS